MIRVIVHILFVALFLQSAGFLCDDCSLSLSDDSCGHSSSLSSPEKDDSSEHGSLDPCVAGLCSLCGHALCKSAKSSIAFAYFPSRLLSLATNTYSFNPYFSLFRPPRA